MIQKLSSKKCQNIGQQFFLIKNQSGMTLIEILVVVGIMAISMSAMLVMQQNQLLANNFLEFQLKKIQAESAIVNQVLNNPQNCACMVAGSPTIDANPAAPGATLTTSATQIGSYQFTNPGDCATATIPQPVVDGIGSDGIKTKSISIRNITNTAGQFKGDLQVRIESLKKVSGPSELVINIPVQLQASVTGTNAQIQSCTGPGYTPPLTPPGPPSGPGPSPLASCSTIQKDVSNRGLVLAVAECPTGSSLSGGTCTVEENLASKKHENTFVTLKRSAPQGNSWYCSYQINGFVNVAVRSYAMCCKNK